MAYCYVCEKGFDRSHSEEGPGRCPRCGMKGNTKPPGYIPPSDYLEPEPGKTQTYCYYCKKRFNATYEEDGSLRCPDCGRSHLEGIKYA